MLDGHGYIVWCMFFFSESSEKANILMATTTRHIITDAESVHVRQPCNK